MRTSLPVAALAAVWLAGCADSAPGPASLPLALTAREFQATERLVVAGQPDEARILALGAAGFARVVSINPPAKAPNFDEAKAVAAAGMEYDSLPVSKETVLNEDVQRQAFDLLDAIQRDGGTTYFHCSSANRCAALWALYQARRKQVAPEQALAEGKRVGLTKLEPAVRKMLRLDE